MYMGLGRLEKSLIELVAELLDLMSFGGRSLIASSDHLFRLSSAMIRLVSFDSLFFVPLSGYSRGV